MIWVDISHSVMNTEIIKHDEQERPLRSSGQPQEGVDMVVLKTVEEPSTLFILASIVPLFVLKYSHFSTWKEIYLA